MKMSENECYKVFGEDVVMSEDNARSMSFKDKLLQNGEGAEAPVPMVNNDIDVHDDDIVITNGDEGPLITLSERFRDQIKKPWEHTVIFKL